MTQGSSDQLAQNELNQKVIKTSPVLWVLGFVFACFMASIFSRVLYDAADFFPEPVSASYSDKLGGLKSEMQLIEQEIATLETMRSRFLQERGVGWSSPDQEIDKIRVRLQEKEAQLNQKKSEFSKGYGEELAELRKLHLKWQFKMIGIRLAISFPILLLAIVLWTRRNKIKYITLFWGYEAAAAWMLVFALGPYLPYYGGYIPLVLSAIFTTFLVVSIVRFLNKISAKRKRMLIDRAILKHRCPACERSYLIGVENRMDVNTRGKNSLYFDEAALHPQNCPSCGLVLFKKCNSCQSAQMAYLPHCAQCGLETENSLASVS